jgi:fatty-acyl-CoA synthase
MAMIVPLDEAPDLAELARHMTASLPDYAVPVFLRISNEIEKTSTFKQRKRALAEEGFDPDRITDPLYYFDPSLVAYRPLDGTSHAGISRGEIKI